jgi:hypothetical protein
MIAYPDPTQYIYIDITNHWFDKEFIPLLDEHFPNRDPYWSTSNLFRIQSNDTYQILTWEDVLDVVESDDCYEYPGRGSVPEGGVLKPFLLDGSYKLKRQDHGSDISYVLWTFVQKGLMEIPQHPLLFSIWW